MENKKIQNGIKEIKEIVMTENERQSVLQNIFNSQDFKKEKIVKSPWGIGIFTSLIKKNQLAYYIIIPLIIVLSGGGAVFASQDSLPNDILYPIKVKILEPVEEALTFSQTEKAKLQSKLATTRLIEAQTLAKEKKLDDMTEEKINKLLVNHTIAFDDAINKASKNSSKKEISEIAINFRAEMNANARILEIINENEDHNDFKKEDKDEDKNDSYLSKTARTSAVSVKNTLEEKRIDNKDYYKEKKEKLKTLIDDVDRNIDTKDEEDDTINKRFIHDTYDKIDEAKKYLEESDQKEIEGDEEGARSLLFDSESLFKEANILINSEINFEDKDKEEYKGKDRIRDREEEK